ncbi:WAT1-related protein [Quillaja saponaria]|uniref:WAT1-related protein n=1 Tax=Quillaja saponaria TaxID=32244 RepID=A0AAD7QEU0_QUISA|nr:WAT1-related protein [Quillaja saponaria]
MGGWEGYVLAMAMIGLQIHYAALSLFTRAALLKGMSPRVFLVYRQAIATLALLPVVCFSKRRSSLRISLGLKSFSLMFVTSLIGITTNQSAYFEGLYLASATIAGALLNLIPAVTFVIATLIGFEKVDLRSWGSIAKIIGTLFCVGGAITMTLLKGQNLLKTELVFGMGGGQNWLLGCTFLLTCSVCWSIWMIMQVPVSASCPDQLHSTIWMCFMATLQSAIFALLFEYDQPQAWNLGSILELSCCLYAGIGFAISFFVQTWCISKRGPLFCAMFTPLCTVVTAMAGAMFLHEEFLLGGLAVIVGLYTVLWGKAKDLGEIKQGAEPSPEIDQTHLEEPLLSDGPTV